MNFKKISRIFKPTIFYITFFLFILAFCTMAKNYDYDLWARLVVGMSVFQTGHVLKQDFLSYTPTHTWYDHEWGSGVIFYITHHFFSSAGLIILQALIIFLTFFTISRIIKLRGVKTTSAYNFLFYYFAFSAMSYILNDPIRCQLFSFLFFTIFLYILELARTGRNKPLFVLPLLMIIWNNLHGGCISGIGLIILYIVGEFLNKKPVKKYIYALIPTVLVLPINPWGFEYILFLIKANTMKRPNIIEWFGVFSKLFMLKYFKFKIFALILLLTEFGIIIKQKINKTFNCDKTKFLILIVTIYIAVTHIKLIPFAIISISCFLYDDFYTAFNFITANLFNKIARIKNIIVYSLILIFALSNIKINAFPVLLSGEKYPIRSIEFIKTNKIKGNLLINFGLGSYASYKLYPNNKIFMDGRYEEVYYDYMMPILKKFYLANSSDNNWDELLKKFPPDIMIIEKYYPVFKALKKRKEWKLVFEDILFGVFVKSQKAKKTYKKPERDIDYYKKTLFDTDINFKSNLLNM